MAYFLSSVEPPPKPVNETQTSQDDHTNTTDEGLGESVGDSAHQNSTEATGESDLGSSEGDDNGIPAQAGSSGHPNKPMVLKLHLLLNGKQVGAMSQCHAVNRYHSGMIQALLVYCTGISIEFIGSYFVLV